MKLPGSIRSYQGAFMRMLLFLTWLAACSDEPTPRLSDLSVGNQPDLATSISQTARVTLRVKGVK